MEDGLLRIRGWDRWLLHAPGTHALETQRNAALRVTVKIRHDSHPKITVRFQPGTEQQYSANLFHDGVFITRQSGPGSGDLNYLRLFPLPRVMREGETGSFQFACVGSKPTLHGPHRKQALPHHPVDARRPPPHLPRHLAPAFPDQWEQE